PVQAVSDTPSSDRHTAFRTDSRVPSIVNAPFLGNLLLCHLPVCSGCLRPMFSSFRYRSGPSHCSIQLKREKSIRHPINFLVLYHLLFIVSGFQTRELTVSQITMVIKTTHPISLSISETLGQFQKPAPNRFVLLFRPLFRVISLKEHLLLISYPEEIQHRTKVCNAQVLL